MRVRVDIFARQDRSCNAAFLQGEWKGGAGGAVEVIEEPARHEPPSSQGSVSLAQQSEQLENAWHLSGFPTRTVKNTTHQNFVYQAKLPGSIKP